jgi:hypothetical protein
VARDHAQAHLKAWGDDANPLIVGPIDSPRWRREGKATGWWVYTLYAEHPRVKPPLYVGFTGRLCDRLSHHRSHQEWWPLVGDIVIERFADRFDALEAEDRRIFKLQPLFNIAGNAHKPRFDPAAELTEVTP